MFVVEHITIAPYHSSSNNQAEQFIDTIMMAKKKKKKKKKNPMVNSLRQHCNSFYECISFYQIKICFWPWFQQK